jgi:hypothetical protein
MQKNRKPRHTTAMLLGSLLAWFLGISTLIIDVIGGKGINGEKFLLFLLIGLIGMNAHQTTQYLYKRIITLERRFDHEAERK